MNTNTKYEPYEYTPPVLDGVENGELIFAIDVLMVDPVTGTQYVDTVYYTEQLDMYDDNYEFDPVEWDEAFGDGLFNDNDEEFLEEWGEDVDYYYGEDELNFNG